MAVIRSGDYYLFETDSDEEMEEEREDAQKKGPPDKSAFQVNTLHITHALTEDMGSYPSHHYNSAGQKVVGLPTNVPCCHMSLERALYFIIDLYICIYL